MIKKVRLVMEAYTSDSPKKILRVDGSTNSIAIKYDETGVNIPIKLLEDLIMALAEINDTVDFNE